MPLAGLHDRMMCSRCGDGATKFRSMALTPRRRRPSRTTSASVVAYDDEGAPENVEIGVALVAKLREILAHYTGE